MFKIIFKKSWEDTKTYYIRILLLLIPFHLGIQLYTYAFFIRSEIEIPLLRITLFYLTFLLLEFLFVVPLYLFKYLQQGNDGIFGNLFMEIGINFFQVFKIILKKLVVIWIGSFLLIIPGLYFSVKWFSVYPAYVFEQSDDPFFRSERLIKNRFFKVLLIVIIYWSLFLALSIPCYLYLRSTVVELQKSFFYLSLLSIPALISAPIHGILEYEVYSYLKTNYKETYEDFKPKIPKQLRVK